MTTDSPNYQVDGMPEGWVGVRAEELLTLAAEYHDPGVHTSELWAVADRLKGMGFGPWS